MNLLVFEDSACEKLFPITTGRPAYAISCASFRLVDWLTEPSTTIVGLVRPYLESLQLLDFPNFANDLDASQPWTLVINARVAPTVASREAIKSNLASQPSSGFAGHVERSDWAIALAVVPTRLFAKEAKSKWLSIIDSIPSLTGVESSESKLDMFHFPHDVVAIHMSACEANIRLRLEQTGFREIKDDVFVGDDVRLSDHVVFDSSTGPILIDSNCRVGPLSFFRGPVYLGPNGKVSEHASIKDAVATCHTCKIGGEVEGAIFEAYTNKQHHGFLGHSYVGSWVNLGAGTCNSDLKNTYGKVNMVYGDEKVSTGMQFMGCAIGDYAKTAINTSIFTGKLIGTAAMVYGFATTNVPSFTNYARTFNKVGELPPEVVVTTQKRMFARRQVEQRPCDIQLVEDMFRVTAHERPDDLTREPISL